MNNSYFITELKNCVKMPDLVRHYGFILNKQNRMPCCFHNGEHYNLSVKDDFYRCFVCGKKGDIFDFVKNYFGLSFAEALKKINDDFNVGLPIGETLDRKKRENIARKSYELKKAKQRKMLEKKAIDDRYWLELSEWLRLDKNKRLYAPQSINDELNPLFVEALQKLAYQEYLLDYSEFERYEYEQKNS